MIRRPPRSTQSRSSAASDVYKRQDQYHVVPGPPQPTKLCYPTRHRTQTKTTTLISQSAGSNLDYYGFRVSPRRVSPRRVSPRFLFTHTRPLPLGSRTYGAVISGNGIRPLIISDTQTQILLF